MVEKLKELRLWYRSGSRDRERGIFLRIVTDAVEAKETKTAFGEDILFKVCMVDERGVRIENGSLFALKKTGELLIYDTVNPIYPALDENGRIKVV